MDQGAFWKDGTWDVYFGKPLKADPADRVGLAICAIKRELVYNGVPQSGMNLDTPEIGTGTDSAIRKFQSSHGLVVDGQVGPNTAKMLLRKRGRLEAARVGAPSTLICQQFDLESACDFACLSANGEDRGISQINEGYHPDVVAAEAFDPAFCVPWQADYLRLAYDHVLTTAGQKDWDVALAAYNVGWSAARKWDAAGRPSDSTAGQYVAAVHSRTG
jgi:hypothetical protein